jgi:hypothetical protein
MAPQPQDADAWVIPSEESEKDITPNRCAMFSVKDRNRAKLILNAKEKIFLIPTRMPTSECGSCELRTGGADARNIRHAFRPFRTRFAVTK